MQLEKKTNLQSSQGSIIALGAADWSDYWMPRQQYLFRLGARGWNIAYSHGTPTIGEVASDKQMRQTPAWPRFRQTSNVNVYDPGWAIPRWPRAGLIDRIAVGNEVRHLKRAVDQAGHDPIALIMHPRFASYLPHLDGCRVVYFTEDAFRLMPGWTDEEDAMQNAVIDRSDMVIACAQSMIDELPEAGRRKARVLRNGVDFEAFKAGLSAPCPDDLARVPEPRIGYTGSVNLKVDFKLVADLATRKPEWHWVFVGPVGVGASGGFGIHDDVRRGFETCQSLPNVHFLGSKPFFDLPAYMGNMTVNVMCYRTDGEGWWKAIDPLKTNEYLAVGRPVVSADLVNVRPFSECLEIATTPDEWSMALTRALSGDRAAMTGAGQARARQNDWNLLTDQLEDWLKELT